jgi:hypothetical protein
VLSINPRFATIEMVDMAEVPIAHVGVVTLIGDIVRRKSS